MTILTSTELAGRMKGVVKSKATRLVMAFSLLSALGAFAQTPLDFNIDWFAVDGGSSSCSGGDYTLGGGIISSQASRMSGGDYGLFAGFWSILPALDAGPPPVLRIAMVGDHTILVSWPAPSAGWVLEQSAALGSSTWMDLNAPVIPNGTNNTVLQFIAGGGRFYRLRHP